MALFYYPIYAQNKTWCGNSGTLLEKAEFCFVTTFLRSFASQVNVKCFVFLNVPYSRDFINDAMAKNYVENGSIGVG